MKRYVGLDVHKRVVQAVILSEAGEPVGRARIPCTRESLEAFCRSHLAKQDEVALEATTNTWAVVRILKPFVAKVTVSNPLRTKAIAEAKVKTDKIDALVLAQLLRCDYLPQVWEPDEKTQHLRQLTSRRAALTNDVIRVKNRIHAVLHQRLIEVPECDLFRGRMLKWLGELTLDEDGREAIDCELRLLSAIRDELGRLDKTLADEGYRDERVRLLMTLPGVDYCVAETVLAALGEVDRFRVGDHAASYLGLVPRTKQSASRCYHGPITKQGNSNARWLLVQSAQHVARHPGPLGAFFRKLAKRKNRNVAIVAVARKLVVIAWQMLKDQEPYRYAQPRTTEGKLRRLRVKATGMRRKSGPKAGTASTPKISRGIKSYTIKPLSHVLQAEGLPVPKPESAGEKRVIRSAGVGKFVQSLQESHMRAIGHSKKA